MAVCHEIDWNLGLKLLHTPVLHLLIQSGSKLDVHNRSHERTVKKWLMQGRFDLITALLDIAESSFDLKTVRALQHFCNEVPHNVDGYNNGIVKRLLHLSRTVKPLKILCCQAVRKELGGQILWKAELLPIPVSLQKNLLLQA